MLVDIASPLGLNWDEALDIICREIIPELERRSDAYLERLCQPKAEKLRPVVRQGNTEVDHADLETQRCRHLL